MLKVLTFLSCSGLLSNRLLCVRLMIYDQINKLVGSSENIQSVLCHGWHNFSSISANLTANSLASKTAIIILKKMLY